MKVEVLTTPDCSNCKVLEDMLEKQGISYELIDVTAKPEYLEKFPIFMAPGLVIDGQLIFTGVPKLEDLKNAISK